jgi:hypothetical protein
MNLGSRTVTTATKKEPTEKAGRERKKKMNNTDLVIYVSDADGAALAIKINKIKAEFYTYAATINTSTAVVDGIAYTRHHAWIYHKGARPAEA